MKFLIYIAISYFVYTMFLRPLLNGPKQQKSNDGAHKEDDYIDYEEIED